MLKLFLLLLHIFNYTPVDSHMHFKSFSKTPIIPFQSTKWKPKDQTFSVHDFSLTTGSTLRSYFDSNFLCLSVLNCFPQQIFSSRQISFGAAIGSQFLDQLMTVNISNTCSLMEYKLKIMSDTRSFTSSKANTAQWICNFHIFDFTVCWGESSNWSFSCD